MNAVLRVRFAMVVGLAIVSHLFGALEFSGLISGAGPTRFVIADAASGRRSGWLEVGQTFHDYTIVEFDAKDEVLSLRRGMEIVQLPLKTAKVADSGNRAPDGLITISIDGYGTVSVGDGPAGLETLKAELRRMAAIVPPPGVKIRANPKTEMDRIRRVFELFKECGITKFSVAVEPASGNGAPI